MSRGDRMMEAINGEVLSDDQRTRVQTYLPTEQVEEMMQLYRKDMGVNWGAASRGGLLRSALLEWWQRRDPEPDAPIEGTATDIVDEQRALGAGS